MTASDERPTMLASERPNVRPHRRIIFALTACALLLLVALTQGLSGAPTTPSKVAPLPLTKTRLADLRNAAAAAVANSTLGPLAAEKRVLPSTLETTVATLLGSYGAVVNKTPAALWTLLADETNSGTLNLGTLSALAPSASTPLNSSLRGNDGYLSPAAIPDNYVTSGPPINLSSLLYTGSGGPPISNLNLGLLGVAIAFGFVGVLIYILLNFCSYFSALCPESSTPDAAAARDTAEAILSDYGYVSDIQAVGMTNLLQVLNLTYSALSYEGAAAAALQFGNTTYNGQLDLVQSTVAQQLGSVFYADAYTLSGTFARLLQMFSVYEGTGNPLPYYCPIAYGVESNLRIPAGVAYDTGTNCGAGKASTWFWAQGTTYGISLYSLGVASTASPSTALPQSGCPELFIQQGSFMDFTFTTTASKHIFFYPIAGGPVVVSPTLVAGNAGGAQLNANLTATMPTGGYLVCASDDAGASPVYIGGTYLFDLNNTSKLDSAYPIVAWNAYGGPHGVGDFPSGSTTWIFSGPGGPTFTLPSTGWGVSMYGNNTNFTESRCGGGGCPVGWGTIQGTQGNLMIYLLNLARIVNTTAAAYWTFVTATFGSNPPAKCYIPTPTQILAPNIPIKVLETMNVSTILTVYITGLAQLGYDYNLTSNLTSFNFCGRHVVPPPNYGLGFGTYALGWVYLPQYPKSSDGKVAQKYSSPSTWNLSGVIYIAPSVGNYSISLDTPWLLSLTDPAQILAFPLTDTPSYSTHLPVVNRTAPSWCASGSATVGCNSTTGFGTLTGFINGNSTAAGGSAYPHFISLGATGQNVSVYLTACFTAVNGTSSGNPSYTRSVSGKCGFSDYSINNTGITCNGTTLWENGQVIGSCSGNCTTCTSGLSSGGCYGYTIVLLGNVVQSVANAWSGWWGSIPFIGNAIGSAGCFVGWIVALLVLLVLLLGLYYVVKLGYVGASGALRRGRRSSPPASRSSRSASRVPRRRSPASTRSSYSSSYSGRSLPPPPTSGRPLPPPPNERYAPPPNGGR